MGLRRHQWRRRTGLNMGPRQWPKTHTWPKASKILCERSLEETIQSGSSAVDSLPLPVASLSPSQFQGHNTDRSVFNSPRSSRRWCRTDTSTSNSMAKRADGATRRTASPKVASWPTIYPNLHCWPEECHNAISSAWTAHTVTVWSMSTCTSMRRSKTPALHLWSGMMYKKHCPVYLGEDRTLLVHTRRPSLSGQ